MTSTNDKLRPIKTDFSSVLKRRIWLLHYSLEEARRGLGDLSPDHPAQEAEPAGGAAP